MSVVRYFEAKGKLREKILQAMEERKEGFKKLDEFFKRFGGKTGHSDGGFGTLQVCMFCKEGNKPKEAESWKPYRKLEGFWAPRMSTKRGKEIFAEMNELARAVPSGSHFASMIGLNIFENLPRLTIPGVTVGEGNRVLVAVPGERYKPPKELERISDVMYEKLTRERKARK